MTISTNTYLIEVTHEELRVIEQVFDLMDGISRTNKDLVGATVVTEQKETFDRLRNQFETMIWGGARLHKDTNGTWR